MTDPFRKPGPDSGIRGKDKIEQLQHQDEANAKKVMGDILVPGEVITDNVSTASVQVGKGNICRIRVTAQAYVAFGDDSLGAVSATTSPGLELQTGTHLVVATDDFIRMSADPDRLEIIEG